MATAALPPRTTAVPWYIWCCTLAVTSAIVGVQWDISWHRSIGRDTFWTPAHMAIYLCEWQAGGKKFLDLRAAFGSELLPCPAREKIPQSSQRGIIGKVPARVSHGREEMWR